MDLHLAMSVINNNYYKINYYITSLTGILFPCALNELSLILESSIYSIRAVFMIVREDIALVH